MDEKLHGKDLCRSLMLANHEIKEVIDPALASPAVDEELKKYLLVKKKTLSVFLEVRE
jgi:hypothetical protein